MNKFLFFCISLITVFQCDVFAGDQSRYLYGQCDKNQVQAMISSSVQAQQEIGICLQRKEQEKVGFIRTLQLSQAVMNRNKYFYELVCAQNFYVMPQDVILSELNNCSLHAAQSQQVAKFYLNAYMIAQNYTHQYRQIVQELAVQEDVLRNYFYEYQEAINDLQELLLHDKQEVIDQEQNARILHAKIVQSIKLNQVKKEIIAEQKLMGAEDALARHVLREDAARAKNKFKNQRKKQKKQVRNVSHSEPVVKTTSDSMYEQFLVARQSNIKPDSENNDLKIQAALENYARLMCDEDMTNDKVKEMINAGEVLFDLNRIISKEGQHISWYVSVDPKLCKKMQDRFQYLSSQYVQRKCALELFANSYRTKIEPIRSEIAGLEQMFALFKNKKNKSDLDRQSAKNAMTCKIDLLKFLDACTEEYNNQCVKIRGENLIFEYIEKMQGSRGILNTERLFSGEDFSTWKDGNITEDFIMQKMKNLHQEFIEIGEVTVRQNLSESQYCERFASKINNSSCYL